VIRAPNAEQVEHAVGDGSAFGARITYLRQSAPLGLAHTIMIARDWLGDDPFCMYLGDNFLRRGIADHADRFRSSGCRTQILLKRVAEPSAFGVAELDEHGRVHRVVEKPTEPLSDLAVIGVYFFSPEVHGITHLLTPSARGELEITDAIQALIDTGCRVNSSVINDDWIDTGKKDDMLEANRLVLMSLGHRVDGTVDAGSTLIGAVVVEAGASVLGSTIRGPAIIGSGTNIIDAYVGPFTAIGANCALIGCEIEHSIVLDGSTIRNVGIRLADSLIGREVIVERSVIKPSAMRLTVGDHSIVTVG